MRRVSTSASGEILTPRKKLLDGSFSPPRSWWTNRNKDNLRSIRFPRVFLRFKWRIQYFFSASTGGFQRISRIRVFKDPMEMLLHILSQNTNRRQRGDLWYIYIFFLNIAKHHPSPLLRSRTTGRSCSHSCLPPDCIRSVPSISEAHTAGWGDPNFSLPAQRAPALRQSRRVLSWSSLLTGRAGCQSEPRCGEEGGAKQLESYCQPSANEGQGSEGIQQHRRVIGAEFIMGSFEGGGSFQIIQLSRERTVSIGYSNATEVTDKQQSSTVIFVLSL